MMYLDQNEQMIAKQGEIISKLNAENALLNRQLESTHTLKMEIKRLKEQLGKAVVDQQAADFYFHLQHSIRDNPILQSEWVRFCSFLKMTDPAVDREDD